LPLRAQKRGTRAKINRYVWFHLGKAPARRSPETTAASKCEKRMGLVMLWDYNRIRVQGPGIKERKWALRFRS
jgi:hypothetical protein